MSHKNILLMNFGGLGDEILFLPVIDSLKTLYPESSISLVLEPRSAGIKNLTPFIDEVIPCDIKNKNKYTELLKLIFDVRRKHFDIALSSGASPFISVILFLMGIKHRIGYECGFMSRLLLSKAIKLNKKQYAARMYHDLVRGLDDGAAFNLPTIELGHSDLYSVGNLFEENGKKNVLIHPGVSLMSVKKKIIKSFSAEKWCEIIEKLKDCGFNVYLAGGPDDKEIIDKISSKVSCFNLFGKTKNLIELAALMKLSDAVVCVDSAPMHIGVCVRAKLCAIFAGTDEKKLIAEDENFKVVTNSSIDCRPCLWDKRSCSCEELKCLDINTDKIVGTVKELTCA